jgi:hypothetical protein
MSEGDSFQVVHEHLVTHAATVDSVADEVGVAAQAAQAVHFDATSYGVFCQALPAMMEPLQNIIQNALTTETRALHVTGHNLRTVGGNYSASDLAAARRHGQGT